MIIFALITCITKLSKNGCNHGFIVGYWKFWLIFYKQIDEKVFF